MRERDKESEKEGERVACTSKQKVRVCSKRFSFSQSVRMRDYYVNVISLVNMYVWLSSFLLSGEINQLPSTSTSIQGLIGGGTKYIFLCSTVWVDETDSWRNRKFMKLTVDETDSWWNRQLMKHTVDETDSWWNNKFIIWQYNRFVKMAHWQNSKLMK